MDITLGIMPSRIAIFFAVLTLIDAQTWKSASTYAGQPQPPAPPPRNTFRRFGQYATPTNPPMNFGNFRRPSRPNFGANNNNNNNNKARAPEPIAPSPPVNYAPPPPIKPKVPTVTKYRPAPQRHRPAPTPSITNKAFGGAAAGAGGGGMWGMGGMAGVGGMGGIGADRVASCHMMCQMSGNMEVNPRCGYDGQTYRNECYLRCGMTVEACDTTCPCYVGISNHGFMQPAKGVLPSLNGRKKNMRRNRGRRPDCKMPCRLTNEVVCTDTNQVMSECEAYCTYQSIKCDKPCHRCPPMTMGMGGGRMLG